MQKFKSDIKKLEQKYNLLDLSTHLKNSLKQNTAFTYETDTTLFVLKPRFMNNIDTLIAWIGISKDKAKFKKDVEDLEIIAINCGYQAIRFESKRKGFKRYAPLFGYHYIGDRQEFNIYEKRF